MKRSIVTIMISFTCAFLLIISGYAQAPTDKPAEHAQVVVVGAGMAGLIVSMLLAEKGVEVILLEKEDVVGGKMYSPVLSGINCNLGTQYFFPGIHPVVDSYVRSLPTQPINVSGFMWKGEFERVSKVMKDIYPAPEEMENDLTLAVGQLNIDWQLAGKGKEFFFDAEPKNVLWEKIEKMDSYEYLSKFPEEVYEFINAELGAETGGDIKNLSAIVLVGWDGDEDQGKFLVKGGNQALAEKVKDDFIKAGGWLYLNSEVSRVEQGENSIKIVCRDGREFTSDYAVVATPADIAKDIVRGLPEEKNKALATVGYSEILELGMHVKNFPAYEDLSGVLFVGECINGLINQTGPVLGEPDEGTIVSICITDPETLKLDEKTIVERVALILKKISPEFDPKSDILGYSIKRWNKGVFKIPASFSSKYQKALREPVGRIFFAGDYTGDPSLMGAAWSGARAAEKILNNIKSTEGKKGDVHF